MVCFAKCYFSPFSKTIFPLTSPLRAFPWRGSRANLRGHVEEVRPINWANRPKSYIKRTVNWDDYPNGRWGDNRSPAYGELSDSHFFRPVEGKKEDLIAMWGSVLVSEEDVYEVGYVYGYVFW
ncbi:hypothetical protein EON65_14725 [archaeon]|nr:MAG: hypothetical protein EON65_14725 [archaeon]